MLGIRCCLSSQVAPGVCSSDPQIRERPRGWERGKGGSVTLQRRFRFCECALWPQFGRLCPWGIASRRREGHEQGVPRVSGGGGVCRAAATTCPSPVTTRKRGTRPTPVSPDGSRGWGGVTWESLWAFPATTPQALPGTSGCPRRGQGARIHRRDPLQVETVRNTLKTPERQGGVVTSPRLTLLEGSGQGQGFLFAGGEVGVSGGFHAAVPPLAGPFPAFVSAPGPEDRALPCILGGGPHVGAAWRRCSRAFLCNGARQRGHAAT